MTTTPSSTLSFPTSPARLFLHHSQSHSFLLDSQTSSVSLFFLSSSLSVSSSVFSPPDLPLLLFLSQSVTGGLSTLALVDPLSHHYYHHYYDNLSARSSPGGHASYFLISNIPFGFGHLTQWASVRSSLFLVPVCGDLILTSFFCIGRYGVVLDAGSSVCLLHNAGCLFPCFFLTAFRGLVYTSIAG